MPEAHIERPGAIEPGAGSAERPVPLFDHGGQFYAQRQAWFSCAAQTKNDKSP